MNFFFILSIIIFPFSLLGTKNEVKNLFPEYTKTIYSGYLNTLIEGNNLFYIYIPSQKNPSIDRILLWLNGGPGCSSLFGMLGEIGPIVTDNFSGIFKFNPYSWNLESNLLFIEQPAGVGFSTASDIKKNWTDVENAKNLFFAVKDFFNTFPELKGKKFNIGGESYAGIFIPHLAHEILEDNGEDKINLEGILIGNGLTDPNVDYDRSLAEFGFWRGIISLENYNKFQKNCPHLFDEIRPEKDKEGKYQDFDGYVSHKCNQARLDISKDFDGNDVYGIYRQCPLVEENDIIKYKNKNTYRNIIYKNLKKYFLKKDFISDNNDKEKEDGLWPNKLCEEDSLIDEFLNLNTTKEKLKVNNYTINWTQCANLNYQWSDSIHLYNTTLLKHPEIKKYLMSGTEDGVISTIGTMRWINKIGFTVNEKWRQWKINEQVAGYVQTYKEGITLITIKGAGHMAPQDKRQEAKIILDAFFEGNTPL
jgi:carboxypeptidase C (cathepsin A)